MACQEEKKIQETVGMSFTLGNIPQNVMCPFQGIAIKDMQKWNVLYKSCTTEV